MIVDFKCREFLGDTTVHELEMKELSLVGRTIDRAKLIAGVIFTRPEQVPTLETTVNPTPYIQPIEVKPVAPSQSPEVYDWEKQGDFLGCSVKSVLHGITPAEAGLAEYIVA